MKLSTLIPRRLAVVALFAAALPFAGVGSADASTSLWGCTVNPERPVFDHTNPANGNKVIRYNMTVTCAAGRTVEIEQHIHEQDGGLNNDDHITSNVRSRHFSTADTITMWWENTLPNTELGKEEMYHTVKFQVTMDDLSSSPWTSFEESSVQAFSN
jgi:hypothetical protein